MKKMTSPVLKDERGTNIFSIYKKVFLVIGQIPFIIEYDTSAACVSTERSVNYNKREKRSRNDADTTDFSSENDLWGNKRKFAKI